MSKQRSYGVSLPRLQLQIKRSSASKYMISVVLTRKNAQTKELQRRTPRKGSPVAFVLKSGLISG